MKDLKEAELAQTGRNDRSSPLESIRTHYRNVMDHHFPLGCRVALVDFPNHGNVGDSAIWLGEQRYFDERKADIVSVCTKDTYHVETLRSRLGGDGIIAVHGGGNFGDVWPQHHQFFQKILHSFPKHKIVQLPQTVFWSNMETRAADFAKMSEHPNLTLFARDRTSLRILQKNGRQPAFLCPDSAMFLNLVRPEDPTCDLVALMRADKEKGTFELPSPVATEDWTKDGSDFGFKLARRVQSGLSKCGDGSWMNQRGLFDFLADARVKRGCRQIGRGRVVITDRLHVHILACLMGIPHVVIDNSYGKLSSFRECWTHEFPRQVYLTDPSKVAVALAAVQAMP